MLQLICSLCLKFSGTAPGFMHRAVSHCAHFFLGNFSGSHIFLPFILDRQWGLRNCWMGRSDSVPTSSLGRQELPVSAGWNHCIKTYSLARLSGSEPSDSVERGCVLVWRASVLSRIKLAHLVSSYRILAVRSTIDDCVIQTSLFQFVTLLLSFWACLWISRCRKRSCSIDRRTTCVVLWPE